ncbi:MAG TPA: acyl carrier protein, partial [Polyangia bacterium]|nr:acyl carrier protein [Polyangia bacterium]
TPLHREVTLSGDLPVDSIALLALIVKLEEEFGVDLTTRAELLAEAESLGDVIDLISTLRGAQA